MDNFIISLNAILPLVISMSVGFFLRRIEVISAETASGMNKLMFKLFLPVLIFFNIYTADLSTLLDISAILYVNGGVILTFIILAFIISRTKFSNPRKGVFLQSTFRTNVALFGLPVAINFYGIDNVGIVALLLSSIIPVFNLLSVLSFELFRGGRVQMKSVLKGLATNPPILGVTFGLIFNLSGIVLPQAVFSTVESIAGAGTPLAFIIMGASFRIASAVKNRKALAGIISYKLLIHPLIWVSIAVLLGFRGPVLMGIMLIFACPIATSVFPMAAAMEGDSELACEAVVFTSIASIFTVFLWIFALNSLSLV